MVPLKKGGIGEDRGEWGHFSCPGAAVNEGSGVGVQRPGWVKLPTREGRVERS